MLVIIFLALFCGNCYTRCPSYPYKPKNGVFTGGSWEYFCSDWELEEPGFGYISFQAKGTDIYLGIFDIKDTKYFKYAFIIGGWDNKETHVYKKGSFSSTLATYKFGIPDPSKKDFFKFLVNKYNKTISFFFKEKMVFNLYDRNFEASNSLYVSFSQYSNGVEIDMPCPSLPYTPKNDVYPNGGNWDYFCNQWKLPDKGSGIINFIASGNDWYLGVFKEEFTKNFQYAIIFSGWGNSKSILMTNGDFDSKIYESNVSLGNSYLYLNQYSVLFSKVDLGYMIAVSLNGSWGFSTIVPDINGRWIAFSQYKTNFVISNISIESVSQSDPKNLFWMRPYTDNQFKTFMIWNYKFISGNFLPCNNFPQVVTITDTLVSVYKFIMILNRLGIFSLILMVILL